MNKKIKNIIVSVIIIILIICLSFTIADNKKAKKETLNFEIPNTLNKKETRRHNYRFKYYDENNSKNDDEKDDNSSSEEKDEFRENNCKCMDNMMPGFNNYNNVIMTNRNEDNNSSLKIALIIIESFLLGGSVMYLILNNINNDIKVEDTKNKIRRVK